MGSLGLRMVLSPTEETWESRSGEKRKTVARAGVCAPEAVIAQGGAGRAEVPQTLLPAPTLVFLEARRSLVSIFQLQDKATYH